MKYECRIPVPLSLKEYEKGYTYSYVIAARDGNRKGDGDIDIEVPETPFDNTDGSMGISEFTSHAIPKGKGFYSRRKYNLGSQVPGYVKMIVPTSALYLVEESWRFPDPQNGEFVQNLTVLVSCYFKHTTLKFTAWTRVRDDDNGSENKNENVFNLSNEELSERIIVHSNIAESNKDDPAYEPKYDPAVNSSGKKTNRGPLTDPKWSKLSDKDSYPICCIYKNCSIDFKVWGITTKAERYCMNYQIGLFKRVAGIAVCTLDEYIDLTNGELQELFINNHKILKEIKEKRLASQAAPLDVSA